MPKSKIEPSWEAQVGEEFNKDYMKDLRSFLAAELEAKKQIYPHGEDIFQAFNKTPFDKTKVVILGQDPYHGPDQAHGMSFSVKPGVKTPPSLKNIYKELKEDMGIEPPDHGYLDHWAKQGVLLLNTVLTVEKGKAGSHRKKGWEHFTDEVMNKLNSSKEHLVFILWGSPAQKKADSVDESRHLILKAPHPSPLSSYRGFFGSKPFSKTNQYLESHGISPIDWQLPQE
jgi:uracil-DNA glycosylase